MFELKTFSYDAITRNSEVFFKVHLTSSEGVNFTAHYNQRICFSSNNPPPPPVPAPNKYIFEQLLAIPVTQWLVLRCTPPWTLNIRKKNVCQLSDYTLTPLILDVNPFLNKLFAMFITKREMRCMRSISNTINSLVYSSPLSSTINRWAKGGVGVELATCQQLTFKKIKKYERKHNHFASSVVVY